jgi:hypothetical protein
MVICYLDLLIKKIQAMIRNTLLAVLFSSGFIVGHTQSLKRIQPGTLYEQGETVTSPKYGVKSVIPDGWAGTLPRDTEVFLLSPTTGVGGEIYLFVSTENNLQSIEENWNRGVSLSESIVIKAKEPEIIGDALRSEVQVEGENTNKGNKGYAVAKCNPNGSCIVCLGISPYQFYPNTKTGVDNFMDAISFTAPSTESIYVDFDWKEFLADKMLISFMMIESGGQSGSKENTINLCGDGTFKADINKKGILKEYNSQYKGRQSGTWTAEGIGERGFLKLNFKKLPAAEIQMYINDEKIYANDERYFAGASDKCK